MKKLVIIIVAIFASFATNAQSKLSYQMVQTNGNALLNRFFDSYTASNGKEFKVGDHIVFGNPSMTNSYMHIRGRIQIADDMFSLIGVKATTDLNSYLKVKNPKQIKKFKKVASKTTFIKAIKVIPGHRNKPICAIYLDYTKKRKKELTFKSSGLIKFSGVGNNICLIYPESALQAGELIGAISSKK